MSGQPNINPLDPAKFRQQYLANLALQANIDDMNLQANKVYKKTGAPTQLTDTRTTAEKQADLYRLRIEVRSKLGEIADGANADKIVQALDDAQIRFLSDQSQFIINDLKPKFRTGVLAEVFIPYFEKYMTQYNTTQGVNSGLQQSTGDRILLNQDIILANMANEKDVRDIQNAIRELGIANSGMGKAINQNLRNIEEVLDYLPEVISTLDTAENAIIKGQIQKTLNDLVKDLPTKAELNDLVRQLAIAQGKMNVAGVEAILGRVAELTDAGGDIRGELQILRQLLAEAKGESGGASSSSRAVGPQIDTLETFVFRSLSGREFRYLNPNEIGGGRPNKSELDTYLMYLDGLIPNLFFSGATPSNIRSTKGKIVDFLKARDGVITQELTRLMRSQAIQEAQVVSAEPFKTPSKQGDKKMGGVGIGLSRVSGKGLVRPNFAPMKRNDVLLPEYDVDYTQGIKPTPRFVPFGRYVINKNRLENDIIAVKRPAGSVIGDLPSKRVSRKLGGVIRSIVGGKIPSFDEINKLDKDEQEYLHQLASKSHLLDRLNIPTPNKDADEKDINQFEIMRGQIVAGNDSVDLINKFKKLVVKMSDKGLLPSRQVKDILISLTENGY